MRMRAGVWSAALLLAACGHQAPPAATAKAGVSGLDLAQAQMQAVPGVRVFDGVLEAIEQSTVAAQTQGRLLSYAVDVNDHVRAGQVLARLRDAEPRAHLDAAEAALRESQAQYDRVKAVYDQQLIAKAQMDRATAARDQALAAVTAAREQQDYAVIRAPYDGIVTGRLMQVGELAAPGRPVLSLLAQAGLRAVVDVPEPMIDAVRAARSASVTLADGQRLGGGALQIFPYADERTHSFRVRLAVDAADRRLFPGQLIKLLVESAPHQAIVVPAAALVRRGEVSALYVVAADGGLTLRMVRPGSTTAEGGVEIQSGLAAGERYALDPLLAARTLQAAQGDGT